MPDIHNPDPHPDLPGLMALPEAIRRIAGRLGGPVTIVDVGAQSLGTEQHIYSVLHRIGVPMRVIGFEPLPAQAAARRREEHGREVMILEAFVGNGEELDFHENNSSGTSSLLPLNQEVCAGFMSLSGLRTRSVRRVRTQRLDDLLADLPEIDFLKLDIQGFELSALRGAPAVLARTAMIQCEAEFAPIYAGQPLFSDVELHLRGRGFSFIDFHAPAHRAPAVPSGRIRNDQLLWADAIFAASPKTASDRALLAQAVLAMALYRKLSVAERALAEFDARHDTQLARLIGSLA